MFITTAYIPGLLISYKIWSILVMSISYVKYVRENMPMRTKQYVL